ncbi:hypothetical protein SBI67_22140 [Mycolicibacterium sp. 120266]|uniref:hypothetical protein n=1 Tax=Mycolicibacterium sp. 120266 TaxID=3090601 RepID=UPI00299F2E48|nr:hypothetical protein [Mycolicibacterium sp. 120266]MDX1874829.1 hypothetical protein [Mycolicibacterium sp. 120266]
MDKIIKVPLSQALRDLILRRQYYLTFVSGTITWPKDWYQPGDVPAVISVQASKWVSSPGMFSSAVLVRQGQLTDVTVTDDLCSVDYIIVGLPMNTEFFVEVRVKDQSKFHAPGNTGVSFSPTGDWIFKFSGNDASRSGVNFRGAWQQVN